MSDRLNEYFAREAGEYLDELESLLGSRSPEPDQFFRLATGVRGSAQMAEARGVAVLAEALEDAARGLASGTSKWSEELLSLAAGTVQDLKALVAAIGRWGSAEDEMLRNAVGRWDRSARGEPASGHESEAIPISDLFYDDAGPHILTGDPRLAEAGSGGIDVEPVRRTSIDDDLAVLDQEEPVSPGYREGQVDSAEAVPIDELLFEGPAAIREALTLRPRIREAARQGPSAALDDLLEELFDLVELGMGSDRPE